MGVDALDSSNYVSLPELRQLQRAPPCYQETGIDADNNRQVHGVQSVFEDHLSG